MTWELGARLLGGIGLFLLGMRLMTEGLKVAAGRGLREVLVRSTRTQMRGVASGFFVTSFVQSSSAITVATIGFVNAGLLTLSQAIAVTYGSNIGTTTTGWLVAAVGFHVNVRAFALPLVGIGMALRLLSRGPRLGPLGEALAGFGVFFLGIDALRLAFDGLSGHVELGALVGAGVFRAVLFVAIGFGLTVLMQSSSAAIAIILTATGGGVVPLGAGAALVIGANVGTTSTAALAVIGATPNAKRVAAGHVVFNVVTGTVALVLLPALLVAIVRGRQMLNLDAEPAAVLAGFHTVFNLLGVAVLWPFTSRLLKFLEGRFRTLEEDEATPRFLDRNVIATPALALDAVGLELARVGQIARRLAGVALSGGRGAREAVNAGQQSLSALVEAVGGYAQQLQRTRLSEEIALHLPTAFRVSRYYTEAAELSSMVVSGRADQGPLKSATLSESVEAFVAEARTIVERAGVDLDEYSAGNMAGELADLQQRYQELKATLLKAGSDGTVPVHDLVTLLDWLSNVRRVAEQIERGARFLASIQVSGHLGVAEGTSSGAASGGS